MAMAKDRQLTPEERRLWREATKHDELYAPLPPVMEEELPDPSPQPSPQGRGRDPRQREGEGNSTPRQREGEGNSATPAPAVPAVKPPNAVLEGRKASRLLRPYAPVEATLDLHGMGKIAAYEAVQDFIDRAQRAGLRHVLIITGKGRSSEGILRAQLPHWLNEPGLRQRVVGIAQASPNRGGSGVYHVVLRRA
ncbi:MAG: hypothetical protein DI582_00040 [Azospirillum brasilense]|nr:MAG: hypothetical protein DI582_00040 [Azospirillum brasilense]